MDVKQLRYFVQIAESGSLSKAAGLLRIAQPSLSQQLKGLEDELGVELLMRHARGVTPTDLGMLFCEQARTILREVDRAKEIVQSRAYNPVGRVSVGLPTSACRGLSLRLKQAVEAAQPGVVLHIVEAMTGSLDEWIQLGRLDVALLYDHRAFENVAWTEMMVEELMLVAAAKSPLGNQVRIALRDLTDLPLVLPARPHVVRGVIEGCAVRAGRRLSRVTDCDSLTGICEFVRNGYCTILPHFAFANEIGSGEFVAISVVKPTPSWRLSVVLSRRTINMRASEAVADIMANEIKAMVQSGVWKAKLKVSQRHAGKGKSGHVKR